MTKTEPKLYLVGGSVILFFLGTFIIKGAELTVSSALLLFAVLAYYYSLIILFKDRCAAVFGLLVILCVFANIPLAYQSPVLWGVTLSVLVVLIARRRVLSRLVEQQLAELTHVSTLDVVAWVIIFFLVLFLKMSKMEYNIM